MGSDITLILELLRHQRPSSEQPLPPPRDYESIQLQDPEEDSPQWPPPPPDAEDSPPRVSINIGVTVSTLYLGINVLVSVLLTCDRQNNLCFWYTISKDVHKFQPKIMEFPYFLQMVGITEVCAVLPYMGMRKLTYHYHFVFIMVSYQTALFELNLKSMYYPIDVLKLHHK